MQRPAVLFTVEPSGSAVFKRCTPVGTLERARPPLPVELLGTQELSDTAPPAIDVNGCDRGL